jgi:hypothetical protein
MLKKVLQGSVVIASLVTILLAIERQVVSNNFKDSFINSFDDDDLM